VSAETNTPPSCAATALIYVMAMKPTECHSCEARRSGNSSRLTERPFFPKKEACVPRFFFDLDDHEKSPDQEGTELASADAARVQGVVFAGAYLRDHPEIIWDGQEIRVIVRDENKSAIFSVIALSVDGG
jgi:hypothetical protein